MKPKHYNKEIDVISFCQSNQINFGKGNIIKYVARAGKKEGEPYEKDMYKALDYLLRECEKIPPEWKLRMKKRMDEFINLN